MVYNFYRDIATTFSIGGNMYIVYKITFKTTKKSYIGYTNKGILERMHTHTKKAAAGVDTHFYKALRLYGISDCVFETLFTSNNKEEALDKEKELIKQFDTIRNGYNIADGGVGGWCVPDSKYKRWAQSIQDRVQGVSNPNFSGVSNQEILEHAEKYFRERRKLIRTHWKEYCKENKLPQTYTKFRFGGGYKNFLKAFKNHLKLRGVEYSEDDFVLTKEERYTSEINEKISNTLKDKHAENKKNTKKDPSI